MKLKEIKEIIKKKLIIFKLTTNFVKRYHQLSEARRTQMLLMDHAWMQQHQHYEYLCVQDQQPNKQRETRRKQNFGQKKKRIRKKKK